MFKLLVILFVVKLYARNDIFKSEHLFDKDFRDISLLILHEYIYDKQIKTIESRSRKNCDDSTVTIEIPRSILRCCSCKNRRCEKSSG